MTGIKVIERIIELPEGVKEVPENYVKEDVLQATRTDRGRTIFKFSAFQLHISTILDSIDLSRG